MPPSIDIWVGHVLDVLADLPKHSVHMGITSPPYFGLRRYEGDQVVIWPEVSFRPMPGLDPITVPAMGVAFGAEKTLEAYVGHTVLIFRALRRVVRPGGNVVWNVGDSYARSRGRPRKNGDGNSYGSADGGVRRARRASGTQHPPSALKPKDRCLVPQRIALAVQADGWWVRNAIPWIKRNGLPGSQRDRPTVATEAILLCGHSDSPKGQFYWDQEGVKVKGSGNAEGTRLIRDTDWFYDSLAVLLEEDPKTRGQGLLLDPEGDPLALCVNPRPYKGAHFAVFPPSLVEPFVKACTSEIGVCQDCGAPWKRITTRRQPGETTGAAIGGDPDRKDGGTRVRAPKGSGGGNVLATRTVPLNSRDGGLTAEHGLERTGMSHYQYNEWLKANPKVTVGWERTCDCTTEARVPATVLDPFFGAGTTGIVAYELGRRCVGIELSTTYATQARTRIEASL